MSAQQQLIQLYGEPNRDYLAKWCGIWEVQTSFPWFPASHILINIDFKTKLFAAFQQLVKAGIHTEIKTYDGCYNDRQVRGKDTTSLHAWACAIDLSAALNPMMVNPTSAQRQGSWTPLFIQIMKSAGLYYGGEFKHRADPMHYALLDG